MTDLDLGPLRPAGAHTPEDVYGSWSASPSPDGARVAFVSDRGGEPGVWIHDPGSARPVPVPTGALRVLTVSWSPAGDWLACWTAAFGATRNEVWLVRPDGAELHRVAGSAPSSATIGAGAWHGWTADGHLMLTETTGLAAAALLLDPRTGGRRMITTAPLLMLLDVAAGSGRALLRAGARGERHLLVADPGSRPRPVRMGPAGTPGPGPEGQVDRGWLSVDGRTAYVRSDVGRDFAALVAVDLDRAADGDGYGGDPAVVLAERAGSELQDAIPSASGECAVLLWNVDGGRSAVGLLDLVTGREDPVPALPRNVVDECRLRPDGRSLLLTAEDWADPRGVWTVDPATGQARPLSSPADGELRGSQGSTTAVVDAADLTRPQLRRFAAPDGLELTGWLYRPAGGPPWPTMIHLHGGPEAQERPVYNSLFQNLVEAGFAVFAPNVRGSTGFGRAFEHADEREKRYAGIADVAACVAHLVGSGAADPDRVGVMGRSYGGYLVLAALTRYPELFAAGVDVCGMADLQTFYRFTEPRIGAAAVPKYGDPVRDAELLRDLSPIHRIDALRAPLLIVHGADDTNVPVEEARQVAAALAARGVPHQLLIFEAEGHDLLGTANRVAFVQATVAWVRRHLDRPGGLPARGSPA